MLIFATNIYNPFSSLLFGNWCPSPDRNGISRFRKTRLFSLSFSKTRIQWI